MNRLQEHWEQDWRRLGLTGDAAWFARIQASYAAPGRHYHCVQHLAECLELFDDVACIADRPGEVAIALWFHDVVYVPMARDNDALSAEMAGLALQAAGAGAETIARVRALVMATARHEGAADRDTALVIDIDLAILGAAPARFAEYERQVRAEYAAVPADLYGRKRREVLAHFLARPAIFTTPVLHARLEQQARVNLRLSVSAGRMQQ